jgi:hypothetical protein
MRVDGRISRRRPLFGEILVSEGRVTQGQLEEALATQEEERLYLGEILEAMGLIGPDDIRHALEIQKRWDRLYGSADG